MTRAYLIDPKNRAITEIEQPPIPGDQLCRQIEGLGFVFSEPLSVMDRGVYPYYFEPLGLMLGKTLIADPAVPIVVIEKLTTWVTTLMVVNQATLIIPARLTANG